MATDALVHQAISTHSADWIFNVMDFIQNYLYMNIAITMNNFRNWNHILEKKWPSCSRVNGKSSDYYHTHGTHLFLLGSLSTFVPSQWETSLQSDEVSHWLSANLESALYHSTHTWLETWRSITPNVQHAIIMHNIDTISTWNISTYIDHFTY